MPLMEAVTLTSALSEATNIFNSIVELVTSNLIFMIPVALGLLGGGIGMFRRLKRQSSFNLFSARSITCPGFINIWRWFI